MAEEKKDKKIKRPSALKRIMQSEKKRMVNKSFKSRIKTGINALTNSISKKEPKETIQQNLNAIYSLMDKGVKKGVCKKNKAARLKSNFQAKSAKAIQG